MRQRLSGRCEKILKVFAESWQSAATFAALSTITITVGMGLFVPADGAITGD
jgi:hypothetical protein